MACSDFASHIDKAHQDIEHELESLVEWTVGIEAGGAIVGALSFGLGEGAAQAAEAGRIATTAGRVASIISHLVEVATGAAETIGNVVTRVAEVAERIKGILGAQLTRVTASIVDRLPGLARDAEVLAEDSLQVSADSSTADDALYQTYLERKAADGKAPLSRDAWQKKVDTLKQNKLTGDAYRDEYAQDLGVQYGQGGWQSEYTVPDLGRRFDIANPDARVGIEVKSGSTPTADAMTQLAKDEQAIRDGWTVTW